MIDTGAEENIDLVEDTPPPPKITKSSTTVLDTHHPYAAAYYLAITPEFQPVIERLLSRGDANRSLFPEYPNNLYKVFMGDDCVNEFQLSLIEMTERLQKLFKKINEPHGLTDEERLGHIYSACQNPDEKCCLCGDIGNFVFNSSDDDKALVLDHDHWTGRIRGVAHN